MMKITPICIFNLEDRSSKGSAKFYSDSDHTAYSGRDLGATSEHQTSHSYQAVSQQSNYHQYHQPPSADNQGNTPCRKGQKSAQPIPKIAINNHADRQPNSVHSTSTNSSVIRQFESVNI